MTRQWRSDTLHLGHFDICEITPAIGGHKLDEWKLPGLYPGPHTFDSVNEAKKRAEQLLDLWLHRAGLEEV